MFFCFLSAAIFGQNRTLNGVVKDSVNHPLVGATVSVKGKKISTTTAADGSFTLLNVPQGNVDLVGIATFMDEYEALANWRRSGYPVLTPVNYFGNVTNGTIPRRFAYPTTEAATNLANYNDAVSRLDNGDAMTSRVLWDSK